MADPNPPRPVQTVQAPPDVPTSNRSRRRKSNNTSLNDKGRKTKGKRKAATLPGEEELAVSSEDDVDDAVTNTDAPLMSQRRSTRARKLVAGGYKEHDAVDDDTEGHESDVVEVEPPGSHENTMDASAPLGGLPAVKSEDSGPELQQPTGDASDNGAEVEELPPEVSPDFPPLDEDEDLKPKPLLQLRYRGFNLNDHCLCIILEPYPPLMLSQRALSVVPPPSELRAPSIAPPDFVPSGAPQNSRMPLFLPDPDRGRSMTPAPFPLRASVPPVPLFNEESLIRMDEDDTDEMMAFSQVLRSVGERNTGAMEDDDDMDGAVLFGDADETRELS